MPHRLARHVISRLKYLGQAGRQAGGGQAGIITAEAGDFHRLRYYTPSAPVPAPAPAPAPRTGPPKLPFIEISCFIFGTNLLRQKSD